MDIVQTVVTSSESADYRRGLGFFLTETPPTDAPKHLFRPPFPRNPHFLALRSTQWLFQKPPAESKVLAGGEFIRNCNCGSPAHRQT